MRAPAMCSPNVRRRTTGLIALVCGFLPAGTADLPFYFTRFLPVNTPRRHNVCPTRLERQRGPAENLPAIIVNQRAEGKVGLLRPTRCRA
jgi:hypothetical protein